MLDEITIELTDYCPYTCSYCSSSTVSNLEDATFLEINAIRRSLAENMYRHIILSGGEPLAHPDFYKIFRLCSQHTSDVVVYSNLIRHRVYNVNVIDGVYLEANITLTSETDKIRVLKRVKQGREASRPEVSFSQNYDGPCDCCNHVLRPNGELAPSPCRKEEI